MAEPLRFDRFSLDPAERRLTREGEVVDLNARYFDALALLVAERGKLVTKDRLLADVWRGVPVTDEALTQCIKTIRQRLGDEAARPRFIETVPKHGYRFIAPLTDAPATSRTPRLAELRWALAGMVGGTCAGTAGGLFYGLVAAAQSGPGSGSTLLVVWGLCILVASLGAAGVSGGIAAARAIAGQPWRWSIVGGALGGLAVGALVRALGVDAFSLLLGRGPDGIAGALEGLMLGGATGLAGWLASRSRSRRLGVMLALGCGAAAGAFIRVLGGRLMAGSLTLVAATFPGSRLNLAALGAPFGETGLGPLAQTATAAVEGALFVACVVAALRKAER